MAIEFRCCYLNIIIIFLLLGSNYYYIENVFGVTVPENVTEVHIANKEHLLVDEKLSPALLLVAIITLIVAIGTVIIAFVILYIEPKLKRQDSVEKACDTLNQAIMITKREIINLERKYETIEISSGKRYTNVILDFDSYGSILFSGFFNYFYSKTQGELATLHNAIKENNYQLRQIHRLIDLYYINGQNFGSESIKSQVKNNYERRKHNYETSLIDTQIEILALVENIKNLLEEELRNNKLWRRRQKL